MRRTPVSVYAFYLIALAVIVWAAAEWGWETVREWIFGG